MKKILSLILTLTLLLTSVSALAAEEKNKYNTLTVASTSAMTGNFMNYLWGNATSDIDVQELIHGYPLVTWEHENGSYVINPTVVSDIVTLADPDGNHTYYITLYNDLKYSDGSAITAADYAFSILLATSPAVKALGGAAGLSWLKGADEYLNGTAETLEGVKVTGDNLLTITIRSEALPYFYELGLLTFKPYPIAEIAPGCKVQDDGNGVYVSGLTETLLKGSLLDEATGYLAHPKVVSGAYVLDSFDGKAAELSANPNFKGNENLITPLITYLRYETTTNDAMMDDFNANQFGLVNKVVKSENVADGIDLVREKGRHVAKYDRTGAAFLYFCCEQPTVASQAVRQAIASCIDTDAVTDIYAGEYGQRVNGYYGMGQWMVQKLADANGNIAGLDGYTVEPDAARSLLENDGWVENNGVMEKAVDGQTVALSITLGVPEGNEIGEILKGEFAENLAKAGIQLTVKYLPFEELLKLYYTPGQRDLDMIFMASNFDVSYIPTSNFLPDGVQNYTAVKDEELYKLAQEMGQTESGDVAAFTQKWMAFQKQFMEVLPAIPLYSNQYFDFSTELLRNYNIADYASWGNAIVEAYLSDAPVDDVTGLEDL